jgi:hypothetical protein
MTTIRRVTLAAAVALAAVACDESPAAPTVVYDRSSLDARYKAVTDMIALPVCSTSLQCSSVAVGARACGGPQRYLVYSRVNVNEQELRRLTGDLFAFEREYNTRNGIFSVCIVPPPPAPGCVDGMCVDLNVHR